MEFQGREEGKHSYVTSSEEGYDRVDDAEDEASSSLISEYAGTPMSVREESFEPYRYHLVDEEDYQPLWELTQSTWYRSLLWKVMRYDELIKLCALGKKGYELNFTTGHSRVFWFRPTPPQSSTNKSPGENVQKKLPLPMAAALLGNTMYLFLLVSQPRLSLYPQ